MYKILVLCLRLLLLCLGLLLLCFGLLLLCFGLLLLCLYVTMGQYMGPISLGVRRAIGIVHTGPLKGFIGRHKTGPSPRGAIGEAQDRPRDPPWPPKTKKTRILGPPGPPRALWGPGGSIHTSPTHTDPPFPTTLDLTPVKNTCFVNFELFVGPKIPKKTKSQKPQKNQMLGV